MYRLAPLPALALAFMIAGCAWSPRVVPAGPQTYTVTAEEGLKWNTATVPARELVFDAANEYCTKRKLVMVPVSLDVRPGEIGVRLASADLVFRALPPGDPQIARSQMIVRHYDPLVVRESVVKFPGEPADRAKPAANSAHSD
jgi:hypothetical protein